MSAADGEGRSACRPSWYQAATPAAAAQAPQPTATAIHANRARPLRRPPAEAAARAATAAAATWERSANPRDALSVSAPEPSTAATTSSAPTAATTGRRGEPVPGPDKGKLLLLGTGRTRPSPPIGRTRRSRDHPWG